MSGFITSADAIFVLTIDTLYSAPITLQNWGADRAWEAPELDMAETQMSVDGHLNAGWIPATFDQNLSLSANSNSVQYFEYLMQSQQTTRTLYGLGAVITIPATSRKYTLSNGYLIGGTVAPSVGRVLEARTFRLRWGGYTVAAA